MKCKCWLLHAFLRCFERSFSTGSCADVFQALLGEWCALVNECRAASVAPRTPIARNPERQVGREAQEWLPENTLTSLLDDVEQDAFLPG